MVTANLGKILTLPQENASPIIVDELSSFFNKVDIDTINELALDTTNYAFNPVVVGDATTVSTYHPAITDKKSGIVRLQTLRIEHNSYTLATLESSDIVKHITDTLTNYARLYALRSLLDSTTIANYLNLRGIASYDDYHANYPNELSRSDTYKLSHSLYDRAVTRFVIENTTFNPNELFLIGLPYRLAESRFYVTDAFVVTDNSETMDLADRYLNVSKPVFVSTSATAITHTPTVTQDSSGVDGIIAIPRNSRNIYIGISTPTITTSGEITYGEITYGSIVKDKSKDLLLLNMHT